MALAQVERRRAVRSYTAYTFVYVAAYSYARVMNYFRGSEERAMEASCVPQVVLIECQLSLTPCVIVSRRSRMSAPCLSAHSSLRRDVGGGRLHQHVAIVQRPVDINYPQPTLRLERRMSIAACWDSTCRGMCLLFASRCALCPRSVFARQ